MKTGVVVVLFLALLGVLVDQVESQCCKFGGRCGDGTKSTPCCGYRPCNLFCCSCDGGCRGKREIDAEDSAAVSQEDQDPFQKNDVDGDGKISVAEARRWLIVGGCGNPFLKVKALSTEFGNLDADGDGALDRAEIGG